MNTCLECGEETGNPKFCSRSCAGSYNNRKYPKRKLEQAICVRCEQPFEKHTWKNRKSLCPACRKKKNEYWDTLKLGDIRSGEGLYRQYGRVRDAARNLAKRLGLLDRCQICGYDKHVEVCHKKSISEYEDTTSISTINDPSNFLILCPNCHWEFDHGMLKIQSDPKAIQCADPPITDC